jgi:hypothetical protein
MISDEAAPERSIRIRSWHELQRDALLIGMRPTL